MSFLQPILLIGLPLALLPIIIHLIHQHRHRTVKWAAMLFLLDAKKMSKGMAKLRQILILAMRVLAIAAIIFAAGRPLASGWVALTAGGSPATVLVLLDRSASMEQQNLETGESKRSTALAKVTDFLEKTGKRSRIVLIDSATLEPTEIDGAANLLDLPSTGPTDTATDMPALLEAALDYIGKDQTGSVDIWILSDIRTNDWSPSSGRWETLRAGFAELQAARFYLFNYPDTRSDNLSVTASNIKRRVTPDGTSLLMDLRIRNQHATDAVSSQTVPVEFTINGVRTLKEFTVTGDELVLQGYEISLGTGETRGWGRIELPADENPRDNSFFFVFDEAPVQKTVIVSDDDLVASAIRAAASSPTDPNLTYEAVRLSTDRTKEIPWEETALLFWHAPLPAAGSIEATQLRQFSEAGKTIVLLPVDAETEESLFGFHWEKWVAAPETSLEVGWWRTDSDLVANTRSGNPLPIGDLKLFRARAFSGETQPLIRLAGGEEVISRVMSDTRGAIYAWGTLPSSRYSSLASDGVAFFVMIHRALELGSNHLSNARQLSAGLDSLPGTEEWESLASVDGQENVELAAGAFSSTDKLAALNRPEEEDDLRTLDSASIDSLFSGLDHRIIQDDVGSGSSLASEIWRVFLVAMTLALLIEAALCLPPRPEPLATSFA